MYMAKYFDAQRERERASTKRARSVVARALCRKNNGSFNYRIDCAKFLSPRPLFFHFILSSFFGPPLLPLPGVRSLFFFVISASVCQFLRNKVVAGVAEMRRADRARELFTIDPANA